VGVPFDGVPGAFNAITDIAGVEVGYATLLVGEGSLQVGVGPVRTGVTAILPRGKQGGAPVFAGWFSLNGNGEMTGTAWIEETGLLSTPVMITNTHSVGIVRDAVIAWQLQRGLLKARFILPVVAETCDATLNDINGFHVKEHHVFESLDGARGGAIAEGNVGGGTGMICHGFKGGTGTASRQLPDGYTVGALVQANQGARHRLTIAGVPVGAELMPPPPPVSENVERDGSIIIVIATDAPLLPHQLKRVAKRAALGVGRVGGLGETSSGDLFLAFSTANADATAATSLAQATFLPDYATTGLFEATVQATEEAIINALIAAETMTGADNRTVNALPHDRLRLVLKKYNRLVESYG
jgi:L-aminopeptidase/D-esterase-like protein